MTRTRFRQHPLAGGRCPRLGMLDPRLEQWVIAEARRFRCSPSFVINSLVSYVSKISMEYGDYKHADRSAQRLTIVEAKRA